MSNTNPGSKVGDSKPRSELFMGAAALGILFVLIVPLPSIILDMAITLNIGLALMVLMITLGVKKPLEFNTFPSLLLFTTLFRLALNVASTRMILSERSGGEVIGAFGNFVVGGDLVVGLVIFLILVIIQFVVITKGSNRISEVAARFNLDAMPGKQMAIDADLNSGLITEDQARSRRELIAQESEFYGAMDGAGKFVRGDAVAGLIITAVNIIGGVAIGMGAGLEPGQALGLYAVLTVGDGLVSQIPALVIAVTAGILVTKAKSEERLSEELGRQFGANPRPLMVVGGMIAAMGLVPGLPTMPFLVLGSLGLIGGIALRRKQEQVPEESVLEEIPEPTSASELTPEVLQDLLRVDRLGIEIGWRLIPLVDQNRKGNLLDHIAMVRKQFAQTMGFVVPPIRMRDNLSIEPNQYRVLIGGQQVGEGTLYADHVLAMNPGGISDPLDGIETVDPTFGMPALWVAKDRQTEAEVAGYTVVDPASVLVTHLSEVLRAHADEILTREDVQDALDRVKENNPTVVSELVPDVLSVGGVQRVLRALLRERVPVRNLLEILETAADHGRTEKDPEALAELCRQRLSRTLVELHGDGQGRIDALALDADLEQKLAEAIESGGRSTNASEHLQMGQEAILASWRDQQAAGRQPVLLVRPSIRRQLAELFRGMKPPIVVMTYAEVSAANGVESVGLIEAPSAPAGTPTAAAAG